MAVITDQNGRKNEGTTNYCGNEDLAFLESEIRRVEQVKEGDWRCS